MTNIEFQNYLKGYTDDMPIKLMLDGDPSKEPVDFTEENYMVSADTAHVNPDVPEEEWDAEEGKIDLGNGERYLLINPIIY